MTMAEEIFHRPSEIPVQDQFDQRILANTGCTRGCVKTAFVTPD